jgi:hypothetical protein
VLGVDEAGPKIASVTMTSFLDGPLRTLVNFLNRANRRNRKSYLRILRQTCKEEVDVVVVDHRKVSSLLDASVSAHRPRHAWLRKYLKVRIVIKRDDFIKKRFHLIHLGPLFLITPKREKIRD